MDKSVDQHNSDRQQKTGYSGSDLQIFQNIKAWLITWFVLTEEEKIAAGVYIGRRGKGE